MSRTHAPCTYLGSCGEKGGCAPCWKLEEPHRALSVFIFDPFYSQSVIRARSPNCNQNESPTLLTDDCKRWMEIIVPLFFVFRVRLAFVSSPLPPRPPPCQITALPRTSKTFLSECLGRDLKGEQLRHVEVKGKEAVLH